VVTAKAEREIVADVKLDPALSESAARLVKLGCALVGSGQGDKAVAIVERMLEEHPGDRLWSEAGQAILSYKVPAFHRSMLADRDRNEAYESAIEASVRPGDLVLDIGAGSGLLAMMAARAGAARVVACESDRLLAATAREIVSRNGYGDVVEIVAERSTKLEPTGALAAGADLIVSEVFSHTLLDEGAIGTLNHAMKALARPGARIIPASASIQVALAEFRGEILPPLGDVSGFDLSLFDRHAPRAMSLPLKSRHLHLRSAAQPIFDFDFTRGEAPVERRRKLALTSRGGRVNAVAQWIRLQLTDDIAFENGPGPGRWSHWPCVLYPFDSPIETADGDQLPVEGWHDEVRLRIWS
jgi:type II protein arginine methyltransferase